MANVLIVNSSGRKNSNTGILAAETAAGAREKGHTVEVVEIAGVDIKPCRGCEACLQPGVKGCIVMDDMQAYYDKVRNADIIIYSSPIYWFHVCGQLKQFIDRCFAVASNHDANGKSPFAAKRLGAIFVYGDTDPFNSGCVNALRSMQDICHFTGAGWLGAVYGSAYGQGEVKDNAALMEQAREYGKAM